MDSTPPQSATSFLPFFLVYVPDYGWSREAVHRALEAQGLEQSYFDLICPLGLDELAQAYCERAYSRFVQRMGEVDLHALRIRDKIKVQLMESIALNDAEKPAVRALVAYYRHPMRFAEGAKHIWRLCDTMWHNAGDQSTDFNYYTKRAILQAVVSGALVYWLKHDPVEKEPLEEYIDRLIARALRLGSFTPQRVLGAIPFVRLWWRKKREKA